MKKTGDIIHRRSLWFGILLPAVLGVLLYFLRLIPEIAEYVFARGITRWLTDMLTCLTNWIPFSAAEFLL